MVEVTEQTMSALSLTVGRPRRESRCQKPSRSVPALSAQQVSAGAVVVDGGVGESSPLQGQERPSHRDGGECGCRGGAQLTGWLLNL